MMRDLAVLSLPVAEIAIGERIGFFNASHARTLGESMMERGQQSPIHVKKNGNASKLPWTLVAGLHRLRGAQVVGLPEIKAIKVADPSASEGELRRLELADNLSHRHRRPIERAIMMAEHARLEEAVDHPGNVGESRQARGARLKHSASATMAEAKKVQQSTYDTAASIATWRDRTAAAFNTSLRQLERHQRIHRCIVEDMPDLAQLLNDHPFGESLSAMRRLTKIKSLDARRKAAEMLLSRLDWKSMDEVLVEAGVAMSTGNRVDPEKLGAVMMDTWAKLPKFKQKAHLDFLVENVTPGMAKDLVIKLTKRWVL